MAKSLSISFTEEELATLRIAAEREGKTLKLFAHDAIMAAASECSSEYRHRVLEGAQYVAARSAELNRRLT